MTMAMDADVRLLIGVARGGADGDSEALIRKELAEIMKNIKAIMSDIVVVFREVYQKNVPFVATMLCIIFPKVGEQPLTSESDTFSDNACSIVINEVWFNQRIQNLVTEGVFHDSVLNLFACNTPELSSFMQGEVCSW